VIFLELRVSRKIDSVSNDEGPKNGFRLQSEPSANFEFKANTRSSVGPPWAYSSPTLFPDQAKTYFQNSQFLSEFETAYDETDGFDYPPRSASPNTRGGNMFGPVPALSTSVLEGERTIDAILAATAAKEKTKSFAPRAKLLPFQEMIAYWLREIGLIEALHGIAPSRLKSLHMESFYKPNFA